MTHPKATTARHARIAALSLVLCAGMSVGCKNRRTKDDTRADKAAQSTNASLSALTKDAESPTFEAPADDFADTRSRVEASAALLEQALSEQAIAEAAAAAARASEPPEDDAPTTRFSLLGDEEVGITDIEPEASGTEAAQPEAPAEVAQAETPAPEVTQEPEPLDPEARKQQLVDELIASLSELARTGDAPGSAALALAGLETLRPQALDELRKEGLLSDAELTSLDAARKMFDGLRAEGGIADPAHVSDLLERIRQDLVASAGLRIARAELCTSVSGYGRYETFGENRFIAGRGQEVIVYAEVDGFRHGETIGPDGVPRFEVELTQRLELYHTADDLNTWNRAAETDRTVSRNRQRDYYLLNQVVLPANLTIGKYHLKVVMRDLIGGTMAEAIIPIEIVAATRAGALP